MSFLDWFRRPRLVPIAEFEDVDRADAAWALLEDANIPALVDTDPGALGNPRVTRIMVEAPNVTAAQQVIAGVMRANPEGERE